MIALCNSSDNSLLDMISFLIAPPKEIYLQAKRNFYQKKYKLLKQASLMSIIFWIFSNIKYFVTQYLSEAALLVKSLKSP